MAFIMYTEENSLNTFALYSVQTPAFSTVFGGMFVSLPDLHNSFSESVTKTMQTARANKQCYQWGTIYSEFLPTGTTF